MFNGHVNGITEERLNRDEKGRFRKGHEVSIEMRNKLKESLKGNKNGLNYQPTREQKEKISIALKGRRLSDKHKRNISLGNKGKHNIPRTEEWKRKISIANKGKLVSEETKERLRTIFKVAPAAVAF